MMTNVLPKEIEEIIPEYGLRVKFNKFYKELTGRSFIDPVNFH